MQNYKEYNELEVHQITPITRYPLAVSRYVQAFTLIELVMVIVIVGILAALTVPRFNSFYYIKLSGAVKKVVSDIRYVQQLAVSQHSSYNITFNPTQERYDVRRASDGSYAKDPFTKANFTVNFNTDPQYKGINITNTNLTSNILWFNWEGRPQEGPAVNLTVERMISFSYQGNTLGVYITPNTGRIRTQ